MICNKVGFSAALAGAAVVMALLLLAGLVGIDRTKPVRMRAGASFEARFAAARGSLWVMPAGKAVCTAPAEPAPARPREEWPYCAHHDCAAI